MKIIRIAIVEDDDEFRDVMQEFIATTEDLVCVGVFPCAEDFMKNFRTINIEVVIMDITLSGMSGIQCVAEMKPVRPEVQYLMFTSYCDAQKILDSICAGATGYLSKDVTPQQFLAAIRDIYNGGSPMSAQIARMVVSSFPDKAKKQPLIKTLTDRESEIIIAIARGYSYKEIADNLFISIEAVRIYLRNIYEKLQTHPKVKP